MLCPCCGKKMAPDARECGCGARFVGHPLDENQFKVRRYGPVITAVFLLLLVASAALIITKWAMAALALVAWTAWRAMKFARRDPEWYGGYRTAMATLALAIAGGLIAAGYAVTRIPRYFEMRRMQQVATTQAAMSRMAGLLESYRRTYGSYPRNEEEIKKGLGEALPADYWEQMITYQSYPEALADGSIGLTGISFNSFELRSVGPDGEEGTDDDIILRDGTFFTNSQAKKQRHPQSR